MTLPLTRAGVWVLFVLAALALRRPFEGLIGHATLACWCVLLLLLSLYGMRLAWPERGSL